MLLNSYGSYYHMKRSTEIRLNFGKGNKIQTSSIVISLYLHRHQVHYYPNRSTSLFSTIQKYQLMLVLLAC